MLAVALALLAVGPTSFDAAAQTRKDGRNEANDFIDWCVSMGCNPVVHRADAGGFTVSCYGLPGGGSYTCSWYGGDWSRSCTADGPPRPGGDLPVFEVDPDHPFANPGNLDHDLTANDGEPKDHVGKGTHKGGNGGRR